MKVKHKLVYGIGSILGIFILTSLVSMMNISNIKTISEKTSTESVPMAMIAADTKFQSCQIQQFLTDSSLTQDLEVIKEAKEAYLKELANKWKGKIDPRVYEALIEWEINIDD